MKKHLKTWLIGLIACIVFFAVVYVIATFEIVQLIIAGVFTIILIVALPLIAGYMIRYLAGKE